MIFAPAGDYVLTVDANDDTTGAFGFRLLDLASAAPLPIDLPTSGTLNPGNSSALYSFTGAEGDRMFFDFLSNSGYGGWRLLDPYGRLVFQTNYDTDAGPVTLAKAGTYTLLFEGRVDETVPVTYQFEATRITDRTTALALGQTFAGTLDQPRQAQLLTFNLDRPATIFVDPLTNLGDVSWTLSGPQGDVASRNFNGSDSWNFDPTPVLNLPAGAYTLRIASNTTADRAFAIRVLDVAQGSVITPGVPVSGTLSPGSQAEIYRFDAAAGERFYFDRQTQSGTSAQWRLLAPNGRQLFRTDFNSDVDTFELPDTGTYTLVIDGYIADAGNIGTYSFNVFENPVQAPVIVNTEAVPAPDLNPIALAVSSTGAITSGGTVTLAWKTRNDGTRPTAASWSDRIVVRNLDTNEIIGNILLDDTGGALSAGAERQRQTTITLPEGNRGVGRIGFTVSVDVGNAIAEENAAGSAETNNSATVTVTSELAPFVDLVVSGVTPEPSFGWAPGDAVTLRWTTTNAGNRATPTGFAERVTVRNASSGQQIALVTLPLADPLATGASVQRSTVVTWPQGIVAHGAMEFTVTTDILDEIPEANAASAGETNNATAATIISAPDLRPANFAIQNASPAAGDTVTLTWDESNGGTAATLGGWNNRVLVQNLTTGATLLDLTVPSDTALAAGASRARTFAFQLPQGQQAVGTVRVTLVIDSATGGAGGTVREVASGLNAEANNAAQASVAVVRRDYADLRVSGVTAPASAAGGETITVGWQVTNAGSVGTGSGWSDRVVLSADAVYGNADDVVIGEVARVTELAAGGAYAGSGSFILPGSVAGNYRIFVAADAGGVVAEPDTRADNVGPPATIALSSQAPNLVTEAVFGPIDPVQGGDPFTVSWRVRNTGTLIAAGGHVDRLVLSADGTYDAGDLVLAEVTRSGALAPGESYSVSLDARVQDGRTGSYRLILVTDAGGQVFENLQEADNAGVSAPITLSPAPSANLVVDSITVPAGAVAGQQVAVTFVVRNAGTVIASAPWTDRIYFDTNTTVSGARILASIPRTFSLGVGESYSVTHTITVPDDYADGDTRILVRADVNAQVFEAGQEADNDGASAALALTHPDLVVASITGPSGGAAQSGTTFDVRWTVRNDGSGPTLGGWTDTVWLSRDATVGSGDIKLGEVAGLGTLAPGEARDVMLSVTLPIEAQGDYRLLVRTDSNAAIAETSAGESNNTGAVALAVGLAPYADLTVSNVTAPARTIDDPARVTVGWRVSNVGTGAGAATSWTDQVILSRDDIYGDADDIVVGSLVRDGALAVGGSYEASLDLVLSAGLTGRFTLFVRSDTTDAVFENSADANRAFLTGPFDVSPIPWADLFVGAVAAPATGASGTDVSVSWTVGNQGLGLTNDGDWFDTVWLEKTDGTGRVKLGTVNHLGFLAVGDTYDRTETFRLPDGISGSYRVLVEVPGTNNPNSGPYEFIYTDNNTRASSAIAITLSPAPDLRVTAISAPANGTEGEVVDVEWTVRNDGASTAAGSWIDRVYLRKSGDTGAGTLIGSYRYTGPLQAGTSYSRREEMRLPAKTSERYEVIVVTDADNALYEGAGESNNRAVDDQSILVAVKPRPDLKVGTITAPEHVSAGATASVEFTVFNQGLVEATGNWTDNVYLSLDDKITSDDILVSSLANPVALGSLEEYSSATAAFTVPKRFRGTVYILVQADAGNSVDEWPNDTTASNVVAKSIYIDPIPFADIVVDGVATAAQAFEGDTVSVKYTVTNRGSGDTDLGKWTEQVWLTRDRNRPHPGQGDILLTSLTYNGGVLEVGEGYDRELTVALPEHVISGTYYIMPWVDPYATLLEDPLATNVNPDDPAEINSSNYRARAIQIVGTPPVSTTRSISVEAVTADAGARGGDIFSFAWTVKAGGTATADKWTDRVYLADAPLIENATRTFDLGSFANLRPLDPGQSYTNSASVRLNPAAAGLYVIVQSTLGDDPVRVDDQKFVATSVTNTPADLQVAGVVPAGSAFSGERSSVTYTVRNTGAAIWSGTEYWQDEIWISKDPTFIQNRAQLVATVNQPARSLAQGAAYTNTASFELPPGVEGQYYVYVFINAQGGDRLRPTIATEGGNNGLLGRYGKAAYELPGGNMGQAAFPVVYREPDLKVTELTLPDALEAGKTYTFSFKVENIGTRATREDNWVDRLYLSIDPSLDEGDWLMSREVSPGVIVKAENAHKGVLNPGESYVATATVTIPFELEGRFNVIAMTDSGLGESGYANSSLSPRLTGVRGKLAGVVREFQGEGNNTTARELTITPYTAPNLQVTALAAPARVVRGQKFTVEYTVANSGGPTQALQAGWDDLVYLSRDPVLDLTSDRFVGSFRHTGGLAAGGGYDVRLDLALPGDLGTEAYYVFVVTDPARYDATGRVFETDERDNTRGSAIPMVIDLPPPSDIQVTGITVPADGRPGDPLTISWTVKNTSTVTASGSWTDAVYLSSDATWDIGDKLLGRGDFSGTLLADGSYTLNLTTTMPGASPGNYRIIVRTDARNQLHEDTGEANNTSASADTLGVSVETLTLDIPTTVTLMPGQERLYRIEVPAGQTLRFRVDADDERAINEVFLRHDAVPTSAAYRRDLYRPARAGADCDHPEHRARRLLRAGARL